MSVWGCIIGYCSTHLDLSNSGSVDKKDHDANKDIHDASMDIKMYPDLPDLRAIHAL